MTEVGTVFKTQKIELNWVYSFKVENYIIKNSPGYIKTLKSSDYQNLTTKFIADHRKYCSNF